MPGNKRPSLRRLHKGTDNIIATSAVQERRGDLSGRLGPLDDGAGARPLTLTNEQQWGLQLRRSFSQLPCTA